MFPKRIVIIGALSILLIILAVCFFKYEGKEKIKQSSITPPPDIYKPAEETKEKKKIVLFFLSENDSYLHPEEREIYSFSSVSDEAKQVIEELIRGSQKGYLSPLPSQTKLRELFITERGVAYVDLSKDFKGEYSYGSSSEISTIYSVVNSLTYNFESIKKVFILIEGGEKETLGGHIGLSKSFLPQYSLIAR